MATYTKRILSGSTNGKGIKVAQTATPGTTIHTAVTGTSDFDEVWIWAINSHTADVLLTIEYGDVSSPDNLIIGSIPAKSGLYTVVPGLLLQNDCVIRAFADTANVVCIYGFVNRITA